MNRYVKKRISAMEPYKVQDVDEGEIKLDAQENPYDIPGEIKDKIKERIYGIRMNRYPDPDNAALKRYIADYCGVSPENIVLGNGSDELIMLLLFSCGGEGKKAAAAEPTFSMYRILSELTGTVYKGIPHGEGFSLPDKDILSVSPDIVFMAYPNNPTGNCYSKEKINRILSSDSVLTVLDEAYYEFSGKSFISSVQERENLVVLRTFSKAFSLAGVRAGYLITNENLARELRKAQLPYNFSSVAQVVVEEVIKNRESILYTVNELVESRKKLYRELEGVSFIKPYNTEANFILMKIEKIRRVLDSLRKRNIKVRRFKSQSMRDKLRVTVGRPEENERFLKAVIESFSGYNVEVE